MRIGSGLVTSRSAGASPVRHHLSSNFLNASKVSVVGVILCATAAPDALAGEPPSYTVRSLGQSNFGLAFGNDINDRGDVAGELDFRQDLGLARHAIVWPAQGGMIDLTQDELYLLATAEGISNSGTVVGNYTTDGSIPSGSFRWSNGTFESIPVFAPGQVRVQSVDERGQFVGRAMNKEFLTPAVVWDSLLRHRDLPMDDARAALAHDINGWGQIAGTVTVSYTPPTNNAFLWNPSGDFIDLGGLPGLNTTRAHALNNRGEVVGYSGNPFDDHAFYWTEATGMLDLGNLGIAFGASASDINDAGVIVGYTYRGDGRVAAVWHDMEIYDLNTLVETPGWRLGEARGINEQGQIVGDGRFNNRYHAVIVTPTGQLPLTSIGPTPGVAGRMNTIEVRNATAGGTVFVAYGSRTGVVQVPGCDGVTIDIQAPRATQSQADDQGTALVTGFVPRAARGSTILFQAIDIESCRTSNLVVRTID